MTEFVALTVVIAVAYGLAAYGNLKPPKPVVIPAPARKPRRRSR